MAAIVSPEGIEPYEKRRHRRLAALRGTRLRSFHTGLVKGALTDLSVGGCRVVTRSYFRENSRVCLHIDGLQSWWGTIAWQQEEDVGIIFERPLDPAVVEHIARTTPR